MTAASIALPQYQSYKKVWALKIAEVGPQSEFCEPVTIYPEDRNFAAFMVLDDYVRKHKPVAGGYWVRYEDGYESFSPAEAFESGYALIADGTARIDKVDRAPSIPPYQDRVKMEAEALAVKLEALTGWLGSSTTPLFYDEYQRMRTQEGYMQGYLDALRARIAAFRP